MNTLFINCVCSNTGDAAILQGAREVLQDAWQSAQFVVQDDHPERVGDLYPDMEVRGSCYWHLAYSVYPGWRDRVQRQLRLLKFAVARRLWAAGQTVAAQRMLSPTELNYLAAYDRADLVVATGGTYLVEKYDLGQRLFDMETAIALGRPLVLYTQSLGPFNNIRYRRRLRRILSRAKLVVLRDNRSAEHLRELGVPPDRLLVAPDAAFALVDEDLALRPSILGPTAHPCPRIAISVRQWNYFELQSVDEGMRSYCESIESLVIHLVQRYDAEVIFLSTCQGATGYHDDSQVAAAIVDVLPESIQNNVHVNREFHTPARLKELLRGFDCVISTRMHLAILAIGVGVPVLPIAYEFKTTELFNMLGYSEPPLRIDQLSPDALIASFEKFSQDYGSFAKEINRTVTLCRQEAWRVSKAIANCLPQQTASDPDAPLPTRNATSSVCQHIAPITIPGQ